MDDCAYTEAAFGTSVHMLLGMHCHSGYNWLFEPWLVASPVELAYPVPQISSPVRHLAVHLAVLVHGTILRVSKGGVRGRGAREAASCVLPYLPWSALL